MGTKLQLKHDRGTVGLVHNMLAHGNVTHTARGGQEEHWFVPLSNFQRRTMVYFNLDSQAVASVPHVCSYCSGGTVI